MTQIDPRATWLGIESPTGYPKWECLQAGYRDAEESDGSCNIYVVLLRGDGSPAPNVKVWQDWIDERVPKQTDADGKCDFFMSPDSNFDSAKGQRGVYKVYIGTAETPSDTVTGMGLPLSKEPFSEKRQVNYDLVFQYRDAPAPPPPPVQTLEQAVIAEALKHDWMPINTDAALYKAAQTWKMGYPQTDEFKLTFGGAIYIAQVFNLGIAYVKKDDWGNVKWVAK